MATFLRIDDIYTLDPTSKLAPKDAFFPDDPFGIVMFISASPNLVDENLKYDIVYQMVNPRNDPFKTVWYTKTSGKLPMFHTIDWHTRQVFEKSFFGLCVSWKKYSDAVRHVRGPSKHNGVFAVRGSIEVVGMDLFDLTLPFAFPYRVREN